MDSGKGGRGGLGRASPRPGASKRTATSVVGMNLRIRLVEDIVFM
jgi:hypothetical protein